MMAAVRSRVPGKGRGATCRVILTLWLVLWPAGAFAHAQLQATVPAAGAILDSPPAEVVLIFNEPVSPLSARWTGPDGATKEVAVRAEGALLVIAAPSDAGRGTHVLTWRVVSEDGHPVGGAHVFSIGAASATAAVDAGEWPARMAALARAVLTLALALGVGALAAGAILAAPVPAPVRPFALTTVPAAALLLAAQVADLGGGFAAVLRLEAWLALRSSPFLITGVLALVSLGLALCGRRLPAIVAFAVGGASYAVAGHAATAAPWAAVAVTIHAGLALFWAGSLVVLTTRDGRAVALVPFGRIAAPMLAVLVAAGVALAWVQLEPGLRGWAVPWQTAYGQVLAAKLGLVALVIGLAALNRWWFVPSALAGADRGIRRSIPMEVLLMIGVLLLTAAFRMTPPPRALTEPVVAAHFHGRLTGADLRLMPGLTGWNRVEITPHDADFAPLVPLQVTLAFSHPEAAIGPIVVEARVDPKGRWVADAALPIAGEWRVVMTILVDDFTQDQLGSTLRIE